MNSVYRQRAVSTTRFRSLSKSLGVTLAELMISIGLGMMLVAGLSMFYLQMVSTNESILQETALALGGSKALNAIDFAVEHAGYIPNKYLGLSRDEVYEETEMFPRGETFIAGQFSNNDKILIRTSGENNITSSDCIGEDIIENEQVEMGFYVTDTHNLICKSTHISNTLDPYEATIAKNVEAFRVTQYGTDYNDTTQYVVPPSLEKPEGAHITSLLVEMIVFSNSIAYQTPKAQILTYADSSQFTIVSKQKYVIASRHMNFFNY